MQTEYRVTQNWLTQKPSDRAFFVTAVMTFILFAVSNIFFAGFFNTGSLMPASSESVFNHNEYWRAWTALFAHADWGHLLSNSLMFVPLTYLLTGYFGYFLFPIVGLFIGGLINLVVLKTMPLEASIIGISGVVYWMGATWLTLFAFIDTRKTVRRRLALALFLSILLFAPQTYEPGISYLSHLLGYVTGLLSGAVYYWIYRIDFKKLEVREEITDEDFVHPEFRQELNVVQLPSREISAPQWKPSDL